MPRDASGLEQMSDEQRAEDLYLLAEKRFYESPEESPEDAGLLQAMGLALIAKQLCRLVDKQWIHSR